MSFSTDDRKLRGGNGNRFPFDPAAETGALLAEVVAEALKADFAAIPSHVKHLARLTGTNERTVHNWLLARNGPSGTALVVLMRHSDAVTEAVMLLANREDAIRANKLQKAAKILRASAASLIDCLDSQLNG
jgi:pyocin large subunit-like protein